MIYDNSGAVTEDDKPLRASGLTSIMTDNNDWSLLWSLVSTRTVQSHTMCQERGVEGRDPDVELKQNKIYFRNKVQKAQLSWISKNIKL